MSNAEKTVDQEIEIQLLTRRIYHRIIIFIRIFFERDSKERIKSKSSNFNIEPNFQNFAIPRSRAINYIFYLCLNISSFFQHRNNIYLKKF